MTSDSDKTLVIVESPAKAKTIAQFLGEGYVVEASFGHVRDLPDSASEIPEAVKKEKWARLGVNPAQDFQPLYIVPSDKKRHVAQLKSAMKDVGTILLATDEDREGESISWHLLQVLKPPQRVRVKRIVFHEITREAIRDAIAQPRELDEALVRAQESRRILDRLYGYTLSPLLWKKVAPRLSAGRVQSVATRLIVERERQRKAFRTASFWDLQAELGAAQGRFKATLIRIGESRLASGRSFDSTTGELRELRHRLLDETSAGLLADRVRSARPWTVSRLEVTPGVERPVPPFTTSTLQQEANRKLRFSSKRTMQIAQGLYEGIELSGERVGLITYMRTDSLTLSEKAIGEARAVIHELYGAEYLPPEPVRYRTTSKNAQEAHEAIRPTDVSRRPQDVRSFLDDEQYRLYEMIWKRTVACQMVPARVQRTQIEITVQDLVFTTSGKQIAFPGFLRAYVEGSDDPEAELGDQESLLPNMQEGQELKALAVQAQGHTTRPPARYTEASLVKKLEDGGIGRPSTYATIISTIQDRGYIFKRGNELIPTFTAFCVTDFLEKHFRDLVDVEFTSVMEDQLDEISRGQRDSLAYLRAFYQGEPSSPGLMLRVEAEQQRLDFPRILLGEDPESSQDVLVKMGRYGPYLQRGEGGEGNFAPVPEELPPAELSLELALEMLNRRALGPEVLCRAPGTGAAVTLNKGRFGDYLEVAPTSDDGGDARPKRVSLPQGLASTDVTPEIALKLIALPRTVGKHPDTGQVITTALGRFGPFVKCGDEFRSLKSWEHACEIPLSEAVALLAQPKRGRGQVAAAPAVLRELGVLPGADGAVRVLDGRYGPYITNGETNAPIPKGRSWEDLSPDEVASALAERRGTGKKKSAGAARRSAVSASSGKRVSSARAQGEEGGASKEKQEKKATRGASSSGGKKAASDAPGPTAPGGKSQRAPAAKKSTVQDSSPTPKRSATAAKKGGLAKNAGGGAKDAPVPPPSTEKPASVKPKVIVKKADPSNSNKKS